MRGQNKLVKGFEKRYFVIEECFYHTDAGDTINVCLLSKLFNETRLIKSRFHSKITEELIKIY